MENNKEQTKEVKITNTSEEASQDLIHYMLIQCRDAFLQARTGKVPGVEIGEMKHNQRKRAQEEGINLIVNSQITLITFIRSIVKRSSRIQWAKDNKGEKVNKFEEADNNYTELMAVRKTLQGYYNVVIQARRTRNIADDFLHTVDLNDGEGCVHLITTKLFDKTVIELEDLYECINDMLLEEGILAEVITHNQSKSKSTRYL